MLAEEAALKILSMEIRGAAKIARTAAQALVEEAKASRCTTAGDLKKELKAKAKILKETRPTAISLRNGIFFTLQGIWNLDEMDAIKAKVISNGEDFVQSSLTALDRIGEIGSNRIRDRAKVLTHCNSSAALAAIIHAYENGKNVEVFATESRPWRQGLLTVKQLADHGIPATLIIDSAVRYFMREVDVVIVGADTVTANGAVINKIGTSQVALCAHEARVPFMVCAETYKFSPETAEGEMVDIEERDTKEIAELELEDVQIRNPVFDATPAEYIDSIITERGLIAPHAAQSIIRELFGDVFGKEDINWL